MTAVTIVALRGSFASPCVAASSSFILGAGMMRSLPIAWRVLGATRIDPIAEDRVAAASPIGTMGPHRAIRLMTSWSATRTSGATEVASFTTTKK